MLQWKEPLLPRGLERVRVTECVSEREDKRGKGREGGRGGINGEGRGRGGEGTGKGAVWKEEGKDGGRSIHGMFSLLQRWFSGTSMMYADGWRIWGWENIVTRSKNTPL